VTMLIDPSGRISGVKVKSADQPAFGLALAAAVEGFVFDPALKDGKPTQCLLNFEQRFTSRDLSDEAGDACLADERKHPERIVSANVLDAPPKPVSRRSPRFPVTAAPETTTGSALIECLIDKKGRVRLPRIVEASEPAFGYAAVQALAAWWFEPPKSKGDAVVVRVRVPFKFDSGGPAPADTTPPAKSGQDQP
jgi:TonB family protein